MNEKRVAMMSANGFTKRGWGRIFTVCLMAILLPLTMLGAAPKAHAAPNPDTLNLTSPTEVNLGGDPGALGFLPKVPYTIQVSGTELEGQVIELKLDEHLTKDSATYDSGKIASDNFDAATNTWKFTIAAGGITSPYQFTVFAKVTEETWKTLYPDIPLKSTVSLLGKDSEAITVVRGELGTDAAGEISPYSVALINRTNEGSGNRIMRLEVNTRTLVNRFLLWEPVMELTIPKDATIVSKSAGGTWDSCPEVGTTKVCTFVADPNTPLSGNSNTGAAWLDLNFMDDTLFPDGSTANFKLVWKAKTYNEVGTSNFATIRPGGNMHTLNLTIGKYDPTDLYVSVAPDGGSVGGSHNPQTYGNTARMDIRSLLQVEGGANNLVMEAPYEGNEGYWGNSNITAVGFSNESMQGLPAGLPVTLEYLSSDASTEWKTFTGLALKTGSLPNVIQFTGQVDSSAGQFLPSGYVSAAQRVELPVGSKLVGVRVRIAGPDGGPAIPYQAQGGFVLSGTAQFDPTNGANENLFPLTVKSSAETISKGEVNGQSTATERTVPQNMLRVGSNQNVNNTTLIVGQPNQMLDITIQNRDALNSVAEAVMVVVLPKGVHYAGFPVPDSTKIRDGKNFLGQVYPTIENGGLIKIAEGILQDGSGQEYVSFKFRDPLPPGAPEKQLTPVMPNLESQFGYKVPVSVSLDALTPPGQTTGGSVWAYVSQAGYPNGAIATSSGFLLNKYNFGMSGTGSYLPARQRDTKIAAPGEMLIDKEVKSASSSGFGKTAEIAAIEDTAEWRLTAANFLSTPVTSLVLQDAIPIADVNLVLSGDVSVQASPGVTARVLYSNHSSANTNCDNSNANWHAARVAADTKFCIGVDSLVKDQQIVATYKTQVKAGVDLGQLPAGTKSTNTVGTTFVNSGKILVAESAASVVVAPEPALTVNKVWESGGSAKLTSGDVPAGADVKWTYTVTNTGNTNLKEFSLSDVFSVGGVAKGTYDIDKFTLVSPSAIPAAGLAPKASATYTITDKALVGAYKNVVKVTGAAVDKTGEPLGVAAENTASAEYTGIQYGSVVFDGNGSTGGTAPSTETGVPGSTRVLGNQGTLTKTNYTFAGWNTKANGTGTSYAAGAPYTFTDGSVTLYAQWTGIQVVISYNNNGGSGTMSATPAMVGAPIALPKNTFSRTGYTFTEWNTATNGGGTSYADQATVTVSGGITLYAQWKPDAASVSFNANTTDAVSGLPTAVSGTVDQSLTLPSGVPVRAGYTFGGWYENTAGTGASYSPGAPFVPKIASTVLYAKWNAGAASVKYDKNTASATGAMTDSPGVTGGTVVLKTNVFVRDGYTFAGWNTKADGVGGTSYVDGASVTLPVGGLVLYAQWAPKTVQITYDKNGGVGPELHDTGLVDSTVKAAANTYERVGYTFTGWNTKADAVDGTAYAVGADVKFPASGLTLYAQWTADPASVAFNKNTTDTVTGMPNTMTGVTDQNVALPAGPDRIGYRFTGWNTQTDGNGSAYIAGTSYMLAGNTTLYAQWSSAESFIDYHANDGSGTISSTEGKTGEEVRVAYAAALTRSGYEFNGWNTRADGTGDPYAENAKVNLPAGGMTLYAQWRALESTVSFDANGTGVTGVPSAITGVTDAAKTVPTGVPVRSGYEFAGWNTLADPSTGSGVAYAPGGAITMPVGSVVLFAQWTALESTLTFDGNAAGVTGVPNPVVSVTGDKLKITTDVPLRNGYQFVKWTVNANGTGDSYVGTDAFTFPAGGVTLYAQWTALESTVVFDGNAEGVTGVPANLVGVTDQSKKIPSSPPVLVGYDFVEWNTTAGGTGDVYQAGTDIVMPADGTTLYAQWEAQESVITFDANGTGVTEMPSSITGVTDGVETIPATVPVRAGYQFLGWNTTADGTGDSYQATGTIVLPAGSATLYAQWDGAPSVGGGDGDEKNEDDAYAATIPVGGTHTFTTSGIFDSATVEGDDFPAEVTVATNGNVTFEAKNSVPGVYTFRVVFADAPAQTTTVTYAVTVQGRPIVTGGEATIPVDGSKVFQAAPQTTGTIATAEVAVSPSAGVVTADVSGEVVFTGTGVTVGTYTFTVVFTDDLGQTGTADFTVVVSTAPAIDGGDKDEKNDQGEYVATVPMGGIHTFTTSGVFATSAVEGDDFAGEVSVARNGNVTYAAKDSTPGVYSFRVVFADAISQTTTVTYKVTVQAPPTATGGMATIGLESSHTFQASPVTTGVIESVSVSPALSSVLADKGGKVEFRGGGLEVGTYAFTVTFTDQLGQTGSADFTVTVKGSPSIGGGDEDVKNQDGAYVATIPEGGTHTFTTTGVFKTSKVEGDTSAGRVTVTESGNVTFEAKNSVPGVYTFRVVFEDEFSQTTTVAYVVTVQGRPIVTGGEAVIPVDGSKVFQAAPVTTGTISRAEVTKVPAAGVVMVDKAGEVRYDGAGVAVGTYTFEVTFTDDLGQKGMAEFVVTVSKAPVIDGGDGDSKNDKGDYIAIIPMGGTHTFTTSGVFATSSLMGLEENEAFVGEVVVAENGNVRFEAGESPAGEYAFRVEFADGAGQSMTVTYVVVIQGPPVVVGDAGIEVEETKSVTVRMEVSTSGTIVKAEASEVPEGTTVSADTAGSVTFATGVAKKGSYSFKVTYTDQLGQATVQDFSVVIAAQANTELVITRYSGADRYETSLNLNSQRLVPGAPVFVATGGNFPDSLSAGPAVTVQGGALVLSNKGEMKAGMLNHLVTANPSAVYIMGGTGAISAKVETQLKDKFPGKVKRVGGVDRYETSAMIAQEFFRDQDVSKAFIASGANFPDALTASAVGGALKAPVLLAGGGKNATALNPAITSFLSSKNVKELVIAGGEVAVGPKLKEALDKTFTVSRQGGADRYATNLMVNAMLDEAFPDTELHGVWLAAGANFPDALSAAVPAGQADQRLVLSKKTCVSPTVLNWVFKTDSKVNFVGIVGGTSVLSDKFDRKDNLSKATCTN